LNFQTDLGEEEQNMPKGNKTIRVFDESDYEGNAPCGFYVQGRPSLHKMKMRLHRKKCPVCSDPKYRDNTAEISHAFFKAQAPPKRMQGMAALNNGLRGCDRAPKSLKESMVE